VFWLELSVSAHVAAVEAVSALFHQHGEGGVAVEQPFFTDREGERYGIDTSRPARVLTYVPATPAGSERQRQIEEGLWHLSAFGLAPIGELRIRRVHEDDWANAWKEHYHPIKIGHLLVKPSWREVAVEDGTVVVEIDPGMAFGTGIHQTTRMCLAALERLVKPGMVVLDQGTGSGILAVAAIKLGAREVWARDITEVATRAAGENAQRNGVLDQFRIHLVDHNASPDQQVFPASNQPLADLVVANIIANVIIRLAPAFAAASKPGAVLIASGIIRERADEVADAVAGAGYCVDERMSEDEWVTLVARLVTTPSTVSS
jgi:ribosomal protein L11 methyltransferase